QGSRKTRRLCSWFHRDGVDSLGGTTDRSAGATRPLTTTRTRASPPLTTARTRASPPLTTARTRASPPTWCEKRKGVPTRAAKSDIVTHEQETLRAISEGAFSRAAKRDIVTRGHTRDRSTRSASPGAGARGISRQRRPIWPRFGAGLGQRSCRRAQFASHERLGQAHQHRLGLVRQLPPRDAHDVNALGGEVRVPSAVAFEAGRRPVVRESIDFDRHSLRPPEEIHFEA